MPTPALAYLRRRVEIDDQPDQPLMERLQDQMGAVTAPAPAAVQPLTMTAGMTPGAEPAPRPGHYPHLMAGGPTRKMWTGSGAGPKPAAAKTPMDALTGILRTLRPNQSEAYYENVGVAMQHPATRKILMPLLQALMNRETAQKQAELESQGRKTIQEGKDVAAGERTGAGVAGRETVAKLGAKSDIEELRERLAHLEREGAAGRTSREDIAAGRLEVGTLEAGERRTAAGERIKAAGTSKQLDRLYGRRKTLEAEANRYRRAHGEEKWEDGEYAGQKDETETRLSGEEWTRWGKVRKELESTTKRIKSLEGGRAAAKPADSAVGEPAKSADGVGEPSGKPSRQAEGPPGAPTAYAKKYSTGTSPKGSPWTLYEGPDASWYKEFDSGFRIWWKQNEAGDGMWYARTAEGTPLHMMAGDKAGWQDGWPTDAAQPATATPPTGPTERPPSSIPDPAGLAEGTRAEDTQTGIMWVLRGAKWVRQG